MGVTVTGVETVGERAFRALYDRTYLRVLSYCLRRCEDRAAALDAAADTYLVAWRRFDDVPTEAEGDALVWLFAVARRVLANQRRSEHRQERVRDRLAGLPADDDWPVERHAVTNDEHRRVLTAMRRLSDDDRELLRLDAWEGLSMDQLAATFDCSVNAIYVRLHRARRRLARAYDRQRLTGWQRREGGGS